MTGIEVAVAGIAIRAVVDKAKSYLESNYDDHKITKEMLDNLETNLPRVELAVRMAEQRPTQSEAMGTWLKKLKLAVMSTEDVLDDFEAEAIREKLKGKGKVREFASSSVQTLKNTIFLDKNLKRLKKAVGRIELVCSGVGNLLQILLNDKTAIEGSTSINSKETSSLLPKNMKIFGRDTEIELAIDMIVGYDPFYAGESDDKPKPDSTKGETSSPLPDHDYIPRFGKMMLDVVKRMKMVSTHFWHPEYVESNSSQENIKNSDFHSSKQNVLPKPTFTEVEELGKFAVNNWSLGVLPIVGIIGVGKTTLAQVIYNNRTIEKDFSPRAWVYVSNTSNCIKLIGDIIFSFTRCIDPCQSLDSVQTKLIQILKNKKFFLVLDDVWEISPDSWTKILLPVLSEGAPGSVVVVTTHSQTVANMVRTLPPIKLDALPIEYFWPLFKHHAFGQLDEMRTSNEHEISRLELIGKEIAAKLRGIPLEAEIIGYLLKTKLDGEEWRDILRSDWWNARGGSEYILPSLGVGYQGLNPELKQSFLYCSIFPKSYVFEKNRLVQMWISHGFVQPSKMEITQIERGEKRLEDIGNQRFEMLVDRFFLQPTVWENKFVMHDLVRELGIAISSNEFYIINNDSDVIPQFSCHLTLNNNSLHTNLGDSNYETLRTLIFSGYFKEPITALPTIFNKSCSLRLLDLSHKSMGITRFPNVFTHLLHLRFLDLSYTEIDSLPDTISLLCHLQVLDLRGCHFQKLPKEIKNLINLRHLYASAETISLISGIGKLVNLQELEQFTVKTEEGHKISELRGLNEIRGTLRILGLDLIRTEKDVMDSILIEKRHLDCLTLEWKSGWWMEKSLQGIADRLKPPSNLHELEMKNYPLAHFPNWMLENENFAKLKRLKLCRGFLQVLPPLGHLPLLEVLILEDQNQVKRINSEFYGPYEVAFPSLKELTLNRMLDLKEWCDMEGSRTFPQLRKLELKKCPHLENVLIHAFSKSVTEICICDIPDSAQIAIFRQLTALTRVTIIGEESLPTLCCCDNWESVQVLLLKEVKINMEGIKQLVNLKKLQLNCVHFESPLTEQSDEEIEIQQQHEPVLQLLTNLELKRMNLEGLFILQRLPPLRTLSIHNSDEILYEKETWFKQQTSLEELEFVGCLNVECILATISTLSSLKKLTITNCTWFYGLPNRLPESLRELRISGCSEELVKKCSPEGGEDWPNISHVPYIRIQINTSLMHARDKQQTRHNFRAIEI